MPEYLSTDPYAGLRVTDSQGGGPYLSTDPLAGESVEPSTLSGIQHGLGVGAVKGIGNTLTGLGRMVHKVPGVTSGLEAILGQPGVSGEAFGEAGAALQPTTTPERVGMGLEQAAEFLALPGPAKVRGLRLALEAGKAAATNTGLALAQGASGSVAALTGALGAIPAQKAVIEIGDWLKSKSLPLVRSAIKPTVASMQKVAGASREGLNAKAEELVKFILERGVTTADKARKIFLGAEHELQRVLSLKNAPTDEPGRAVRYLKALERSAEKQRLASSEVSAIKDAAKELLEGSLGVTKTRMVRAPHPTLVDASGKPLMVSVPENFRALRASTPAAEALEAARASSRWSTRKQWGEQKGTEKEIKKAVERAGRDAIKTAVPEARDLLKQESMAIQAEKALDRAAFRTQNRDPLGLPAYVVGGAELAAGKIPKMALIANWARDNQLKLGIYADRIAKAAEKGHWPAVAFYLQKLGIGAGTQMSAP